MFEQKTIFLTGSSGFYILMFVDTQKTSSIVTERDKKKNISSSEIEFICKADLYSVCGATRSISSSRINSDRTTLQLIIYTEEKRNSAKSTV